MSAPSPTSAKAPPEAFIAELQRLFGPSRCLTDPARMLVYESDGLTLVKSPPAAVVFPETHEQVVQVVKLCHEHGVPLTPRGAGTCLSGGSYDTGCIFGVFLVAIVEVFSVKDYLQAVLF